MEVHSRYFVSTDNDGHWYVIPVERRKDWYDWLDIPTDDEASWIVPNYAYEINGTPESITFLDWRHDDI